MAYDCIVYGFVEIVASVRQGSKHACYSVIMLQDRGCTQQAESQDSFHTALECAPELEHNTNIA